MHVFFALVLAVLTPAQWQSDIDFLAQRAAVVHPRLFHAMSPQEWQAALDEAKHAPATTREEQIIALMRLIAHIQDGHNEVEFPCGESNTTNFPLRLAWFPQGLLVSAAPRPYASIVGGTLQAIDDTPIDRAWSQLLPLVSHDVGNLAGGLQSHPTIYLTCAGILHGLGITHSADTATYTVRTRTGTTIKVTLQPATSWLSVVRPFTVVPADNWIEAAPSPAPLWCLHPRDMFWYATLPSSNTLYVQINNVLNAPNETLAHFAARLSAEIATHKPKKLVLDLRRNSGGDNTLLRPLLMALGQSSLNRTGSFFVLTSPTTFSAAENLSSRLQYYTNAIFIGQPTAENVNFWADTQTFPLPNSGIAVNISHLYWQDSSPLDHRTALYPDIAVDLSLDDYLNGRDPVLQTALTYRPEPTLEDRLRSSASLGFDRAYAEYESFVTAPQHKYAEGLESRLNTLGYQLLSQKAYTDATVIFRINTAVNPASSNAWDSLGDGYLAAGMKNEAIAAYTHSLSIDPANRDASNSLKQLQNP